MTRILDKAPPPFKGTEVHTLKNGLRLVLKEDHTIPVVSLQAWARCGAIDETPTIYGLSHGLEHMVFKGTEKRSAGEITLAIESHGGAINAATQLETTHYYIDIPSYGSSQALDVLADTILNPTFPQEELERERLVILEEIHSRDDSPDATLWDEFSTNVFKGTPYAIKVIGNEKTVSSMTRQDLLNYYRTYYTPENKCMVVVGDFDKSEMIKHLTTLFENEKAALAPRAPSIQLPLQEATQVTIRKPVQLTHLALGFPTIGLAHQTAVGQAHEDVILLDVFSDVIGGGVSSRLYQKLREETQVVLSLSCDYIPFQQKGLFAFFAETHPGKAQNAIDALLFELKNISKNPIGEGELARSKARIKSEWLHGAETPRGQASTLGSLAILGQLDMVETYLSKIDALTIQDMKRAYDQYIANQKFFITQIVPQS